ncbi:MAG: Tfp pilus assembly protein FimT/FimU, partial [Phycisphaerae bacterium]
MRRTVRGPLAARPRSAPLRAAFTIVEMIVVIAVIALVLAIGVPAFNAMTIQQRLSKARQLLNGTLTRTQVISVADRALTAVRLVPAAWHLDKAAATATSARRQVMTTYSYRGTAAANPNRPDLVILDERFERIENGPTQLLPPDTWVAPSEALFDTDSGDAVLDGTIGRFTLDATDTSEDFLSADDFLIVFDPETGVQMQNNNWPWKTWRLLAYDPVNEIETDGDR